MSRISPASSGSTLSTAISTGSLSTRPGSPSAPVNRTGIEGIVWSPTSNTVRRMEMRRAKPPSTGVTAPSLTSLTTKSPRFSPTAIGLGCTPLSHSRSRLRLKVSPMAIARLSVEVLTPSGPAAASPAARTTTHTGIAALHPAPQLNTAI